MKYKRDYIAFGKPNFSEEEEAAMVRILKSGWIGMGPETIAFENELAAFVKSQNVVSVSSCTSALTLALKVVGVSEGDEVICPSFTWCSTANSALYCGATPVFVDIDPVTLCVTEHSILSKLSHRTKAVVVVHFGGYALDVESLQNALPKSIALIEDAAHALGSQYSNCSPVGSSSNLTCFSFYANKNISTGEGGAIALNNQNLAERLRSLRQHGGAADAWRRFIDPRSLPVGDLSELGYKMNFTDLAASIGRVQLRRYKVLSAKRLEIAQYYKDNLAGQQTGLYFQDKILHPTHARHLFPVILPLERMKKSRNEFILALRDRMIGATIHYPPLHAMKLYRSLRPQPSLQVTERIGERILTLPISASISLNDAHYVVENFNEIFKGSLK